METVKKVEKEREWGRKEVNKRKRGEMWGVKREGGGPKGKRKGKGSCNNIETVQCRGLVWFGSVRLGWVGLDLV